MQIVDLILNHQNFYCPVSGACILNGSDPIDDEVPSLQGYWVSECFSEPSLFGQLADDWAAYVSQKQQKDEYVDSASLEVFLRNYQSPAWVTFCLSTIGESCGPTGTTVWIVIDMDSHP